MPVSKEKRLYKGRSMQGTFRFGDRLIVDPIQLADIRPGDVVIYRGLNHKCNEDMLVHRVIGTQPGGLVVQGDNNLRPDKTLVTEQDLVGRISHVERDGNRFRVSCRRSGLLLARFLHGCHYVRRAMWHMICGLGRRSYGWLRRSGLIARLWQPSIVKVQVMTQNGPLVKYVCRNRTVASHWVNDGRFKCRKPFDLVLLKPEALRAKHKE